jgi:hypothetical protein
MRNVWVCENISRNYKLWCVVCGPIVEFGGGDYLVLHGHILIIHSCGHKASTSAERLAMHVQRPVTVELC